MTRIYSPSITTETINNIPVPNHPPIVTFTITPNDQPVAMSTTIQSYTWPEVTRNAEVVVQAAYRHKALTTLTFTGSCVDAQGGTVQEWFWDFGDNKTATGQTPTHLYTYANPSLEVTLRVRMTDGRVGYASLNPMLSSSALSLHSYLYQLLKYPSYAAMQSNYADYSELAAA